MRELDWLCFRAMTQAPATEVDGVNEPAACYGFQPFASRGLVISEALIEQLRDDDGI